MKNVVLLKRTIKKPYQNIITVSTPDSYEYKIIIYTFFSSYTSLKKVPTKSQL